MADALAVLADAYRELGIDDLAADALRVLELNYPDHPALKKNRRHGLHGNRQSDS